MDKRVLIVDDDPLTLRMLERRLVEGGYAVVSAACAEDALRILCEDAPSILITDWDMPGMSGLELCRAIRAHEGIGFVYIIILTSHSDDDHLVAAFDAGADDYLTKPFNKKEMLARIRGGERIVALEHDIARRTREVYSFNAQIEITNRKLAQANEALNRLATTDELTGMTNRRAAIARLEEQWAIAVRHGDPLACMMIDIDHFKSVNDTYGHAVGDAVLKETAARLTSQARSGDLVCRVGGEEFLIICARSTAEMAVIGAERLRKALDAAPIPAGDATLPVTISIGVAERTDLMREPDELMKAVDEALYAAKRAGRNRVQRADAAPLPPAEAEAAPLPQPPIRGTATGLREHLVIMDGDAARRAAMACFLRTASFDVDEAGTRGELFDLLARRPRDAVALRSSADEPDVVECTRLLKSTPATNDIPLILLVDPADPAQPQAGLRAGAEEVVGRDVTHEELALRLRALARLHRAIPRQTPNDQPRVLTLLLDYSRGIGAADDLDAVFDHAMAAATELTGCRGVTILMPDPDLQVLTIVRSADFDAAAPDTPVVPIEGSALGRVFRTREPLVANHAAELPTPVHASEATLFKRPPTVAAVLAASEHVVGVLVLGDRADRRPFTPQERETINLVSNLAASAIHEIQMRRSRDEARDSIVVALAKLAERRDDDTGRHLDRVTQFCLMLARDLSMQPEHAPQIDGAFMANLERAVPLHDIGKVAIPDAILLKPGKLSAAEMAIMRTHCTIGWETLRCVTERVPGAKFLRMAEEIAYSHHEWFDGSGYPRGAKGRDIPLAARIVALADVYDAITTRRVYKPALSHDKAVSLIVRGKGTQFDPDIVQAFLRCEREFAARAREMAELPAPPGEPAEWLATPDETVQAAPVKPSVSNPLPHRRAALPS